MCLPTPPSWLWLLAFFWLLEEVKCFYLHLQLGQKSQALFFLFLSWRVATSHLSFILGVSIGAHFLLNYPQFPPFGDLSL